MPELPPSFIDELVTRNPIEEVVSQYVNLKRSGANLFGLCPFHGEKTPSFSVAPEKGIYYCFGCHRGGGVIHFMMEIENLSYPDAVRALAKRAGLEVPQDEQYQSRYRQQERLWALNREAARYFHTQLKAPVGRPGLEYARKRGIPNSVIVKFGLGFAPPSGFGLIDAMRKKGYTDQELQDAGLAQKGRNGGIYERFRNRLMFPIIDVRGNFIGFGGRVMDDATPKYLNSPETPVFNKRKNLFGLNFAKKSKLGYLILVEGYMDAIALHQFGFDCAVASLGTALTQEHAVLLSRYTEQVVLIYDGDSAGQNATQRAIPILEKVGLQVRVLHMKGAKDPDEFLKKYGADRFRLLLGEASNRVEYQLNAIRRKYDLQIDEQRVQWIQEAAELLGTLQSPVQQEVYGNRVAESAGISPEVLRLEIEKSSRRLQARKKRQQEKADLSPARNLQPKSRAFHYDNLKSAMAEESVLAMVLTEPALFAQTESLKQQEFSSALLGQVYAQLKQRYEAGLEVSTAVLSGLNGEEMAHVAGIQQRRQGPVNADALADCIRTIHSQCQAGQVSNDQELLAFRNRLKERKGFGQ